MNPDDTSSSLTAAPVAWHVLGAGAIGSLWALRLAARGVPVVLLAHGDAAPQRTLQLQDGEGRQAHTFAQRSASAPGPVEHLLVCTKSHLTLAAMTPLLSSLPAGVPVVLLQNGMGAEDELAAQRPDLCLLPAITTDGVWRRDRDTLVLAGHGDTWLGELRHEDSTRAQAIATELGMAFAPDIARRRWLKLAMNCAINPLTARYRCRNGELLHKPEALAVMREVCGEVAAVMRAEGLAADAEELFRLACAAAEKTSANISSMRADIEAGRRTEIEYLNGYIVRRAQQHGLAAPVNAELREEVQRMS